MPNDYFEFRQFTIRQNLCAMKIGTDAVILGAWSNFEDNENCKILDIGTGTGILAIMAAQKSPNAHITAIDIDKDAVIQATDNVSGTIWKSNIEVIETDISKYNSDEQFDYIVSNPPYFENSLKSPDRQRSMARHTDTLSFAELAESINRLLKPDGSSYIIIPAESEDSLCTAAITNNLYPSHKVNIITREGQKPKRVIIVLRHKISVYTEECITVRDKEGNYTRQYIELTADFYKKL